MNAPAAISNVAASGLAGVRFRDRLLFVAVLASFFVMTDPAPHELIVSGGMVILLASTLRLPRFMVALMGLLLVLNVSGIIAAVPIMERTRVANFAITSVFLAVSTFFYGLLLSENTEARFVLLRRAWIIAALLASLAAIAGYFNIGGTSALFTAYDGTRAKATFNDPNVFGPFLIPPTLFIAQDLIHGVRKFIPAIASFLFLCVGQFLSFSRASWAHLVGSLLLLAVLTLITTGSARLRARLLITGLAGVVLLAALIAILLSLDSVGKVFAERASLQQSYDLKTGGRFDNYLNALNVLLAAPWGLGPFEFAARFGEDAHNAYLNTFLSYGWAGGLSYLALCITTVMLAISGLRRAHPLRSHMIVLVASFVPLTMVSFIIHTDHWRHYFPLVAAIWALRAAMQRPASAGMARVQ
ncbi:O-antigen ligase family protein [Candidatus Raskinella chloraquaticus]|uniref:O-antigen ligase-related domain-containing protein n=1 Tax=Candidatus Raskinella chloraquaticus TaxID=1951219 RepID=A0A1W9I0B7_9HYPH|nr:MAG: hypothetical protein A4S15_05265 [Proteobacteria bacterium SG_bin8]